MATWAERYDIAFGADATFRNRVTAAAVKVAVDVAAEATNVPQHDARVKLANLVLWRPREWGEILVLGVLTNPTIGADPAGASDADVEFALASIWTAYALAAPDLPKATLTAASLPAR